MILPSKYREMRAAQGNRADGCDYNDEPQNLTRHSRVKEGIKDRREMSIVSGVVHGGLVKKDCRHGSAREHEI